MAYTRASGSWLLLSLCAFGCEAQASESYLGEPLLQLHGNAIVMADTGGEAVTPALCFEKGAPTLLPSSVERLPSELRAALHESIEVGEALNEHVDEAAIWLGSQLTEIVPVESFGRFPSEFNIEAYLPPSAEFVQPLFEGEPPVAQGTLCAVREGHPDVVNKPLQLQATQCEEEPCVKHYAFLSHDEDAYYAETFVCPSATSASDECERTTQGDVAVRRNLQGSFIEGRAQPAVVYLAAPAKAGSYTAWKYGSPSGLSAGFHLFSYPSFDVLRARSESCRMAPVDANLEVRKEHADRLRSIHIAGLVVDNMQLDPVLREAYERRAAELSMERCSIPELQPVSHTEPLEVRFTNERPVTFPGLPNEPCCMLSRDACQELYEKHAPGAFRRARRMLGNTADADDVVHDVFLALFEDYERFRGQSLVSTYVYGAVTHACLNRMRNQRKRRDLAAQQFSEPRFDPGQAAESAAMLRDLLARLPEPLCVIAVYHYFDELSQREIAGLIGCSHTHVGALIARLTHWISQQEVSSCRA